MCRRSVLDCILWLRSGRNDGCFSDVISVIFPAGLFRVSRVYIFDQAVLTISGVKYHGSSRRSTFPPERMKAYQQDPSLFHIRSSMFHGITIRFIRSQTPYCGRNALARPWILYAQSLYRILSILPRSRYSDSVGK
jgi:hypothetical protein